MKKRVYLSDIFFPHEFDRIIKICHLNEIKTNRDKIILYPKFFESYLLSISKFVSERNFSLFLNTLQGDMEIIFVKKNLRLSELLNH